MTARHRELLNKTELVTESLPGAFKPIKTPAFNSPGGADK